MPTTWVKKSNLRGPEGLPGKNIQGPPGRDGKDGEDGQGFDYRYDWQLNQDYEPNDLVYLDNSTWLCVRAHRSDNFNVPAEPSYYWKMFAKGGRIGFTGERGAQGTPGKDGAPGQSGESFIVVSKWIMEGE